MSKVLLTTKNSSWGIKVKINSPNVYENILSFKDQTTKDNFINKELFNGKDYKVEIQKQPEIAFTRLSQSNARFDIFPSDYNTTFKNILMKDYAIIFEEGEYSFWALVGERVNNKVVFKAELDIFTTYDIKNMFNNNEVKIERGMVDRFYITDDDKKIEPISSLYLSALSQIKSSFLSKKHKNALLLFGNEEINDEVKNILSYSDDDVKILYPYKKINSITWTGHTLSENEKNEILKQIYSVPWSASYYRFTGKGIKYKTSALEIYDKYDLSGFKMNGDQSRINSLGFPFAILTNPISNLPAKNGKIVFEGVDENKYYLDFYFNNILIKPLQNEILESFGMIKNSVKVLQFPPFDFSDITEINYDTNTKILKIHCKNNDNNRLSNIITNRQTFPKEPTTHYFLEILSYQKNIYDWLSLTNLAPEKVCNIPLSDVNKLDDNLQSFYTSKLNKQYLDKNNIVANEYKTEIKTEFAPYKIFVLKGYSGEKIYNPLFFEASYHFFNISFTFLNNYDLGGTGSLISPHKYSPIGKNEKTTKLTTENNFNDITNQLLPSIVDPYIEFMTRNINQRQTKKDDLLIKMLLGTGLGYAGGIGKLAGFKMGGLMGKAGLVLAGASLYQYFNEWRSQAAQEKDLQNTPDNIIYNSNSSIFNLCTNNNSVYFITKKLSPYMIVKTRELFYKFGYNLNNKMLDINDFLKTRYYFNYIKASGVFENIKLQIGTEIKQLIDSTLENGIHIWHVRDDNFKGINNFKYENTEMEIINQV